MSPPAPSPSRIFTPLPLTPSITLSNRLIMAPLTRFRSTKAHVPTLPMMSTYYSQRASYPGSLLITEGTYISARAGGYANVPGIWNPAQIAAWRTITSAVHAQGSFIFCQLWALGRAATLDGLASEPGGPYLVVSSSPVPLDPKKPAPHALTADEIKSWVADYAQAAQNAIEAGFDGVEIHGANGYLPDQFLQDVVNQRTDAYGGSIENRSRFHFEVTKAVVDAIGGSKTAIRLSPFSTFQGMKMANPIPQFSHLLSLLRPLGLAYIHLVEARVSGTVEVHTDETLDWVFDVWKGQSPVFVAGGFKPDTARRAVDEEYAEHEVGVVFGRYYISNPDLVWRIEHGVELSNYNRETFYKAQSEEGYIDYPFSEGFESARL